MTLYQNNIASWRRKDHQAEGWIARTPLRVGVVLGVALLGLLYVVQMTRQATYGYTLSDIQKEIGVLEQENRRVENQIATYRSLQHIQQRLAVSDLVPVDPGEVLYLHAPGTAVARR